jgi:hypothetical protein
MQFQSIRATDENVAFDRKLAISKFKAAGRTYFAAAVKVTAWRKAVLEENLRGVIVVRAGRRAGDKKDQ